MAPSEWTCPDRGTPRSPDTTPALGGRKIAGRDLTDGKLDWWDWGATMINPAAR